MVSKNKQSTRKCPRCGGTGKNSKQSQLGWPGGPCYYCLGNGFVADIQGQPLAAIDNPKLIAAAVEGSMDRRQAVLDAADKKVVFTNIAPESQEWSARVELLNEMTTPDRYLRDIIQYARSGEFFPADMHVDLIKQVFAAEQRRLLERVKELEDKLHDCKC